MKPASPAAPVTFSDANAPAVVGLSPRQLRAFVLRHSVPHCRAGRRMVVRVDRFLEAVDRLSGAEPRAVWSEDAIVAMAAQPLRRASSGPPPASKRMAR